MKENKTSGKYLNEIFISELPDKDFKFMVIKTSTECRRMVEHNEKVNKEIQNIRKCTTEVTKLNTITELKNRLEEFNSRLDEAEEHSKLKTKQWTHPDRTAKI